MTPRLWVPAMILVAIAAGDTALAVRKQPAPAPPPAPATAGPVTLVEAALPPATVDAAKSTTRTLYFANTADHPVTVAVSPILRTAANRIVEGARIEPVSADVPPNAVVHPKAFTVTLPATLQADDFPVTGWLAVSTASPAQLVGRVEIKGITQPAAGEDWRLVQRSAWLGLVVVIIATVWVIKLFGFGILFTRMGSPTFSFSDSWSSTLTIGGGLLTSLLSYAGLPDHGRTLDKQTYLLLSAVFTALIALAPGIYNVFRKPVQVQSAAGTSTVEYHGLVIMFLAGGVLTMTGVFAQLSLFAIVCGDVGVAGLISPGTAHALQALAVVLQVLLGVYAVVSSVGIVDSQTQTAAPVKADGGGAKASMTRTVFVKSADSRPAWPVL